MRASAQNSSGVHWCRGRGQVQRGSGEGSGEGLGGFGAEPGQVQQGSGEGSEEGSRKALVLSQVRFNRAPEKVPVKVWEALVQSQVRFSRVPEKVPEKVWEALVQSQVRFNRVPEKVLEKVWGGFGAEPGQVQQGSGEGSGEGLGRFGAEPGQVQQDLWPFNRKRSWGVSSAWLRITRFRKICKHKTLRLLGIPPKIIFWVDLPYGRFLKWGYPKCIHVIFRISQ